MKWNERRADVCVVNNKTERGEGDFVSSHCWKTDEVEIDS